MIRKGPFSAACLLAAVAVTSGLAGCGGGGDTAAACAAVTGETSRLTSAAMTKISDPAGMKAEYDASAAKIRAAAKGTDIEDEAGRLAAGYEKLAQQVADFAKNPGTTMPDLRTGDIIQAGTDLKKACS